MLSSFAWIFLKILLLGPSGDASLTEKHVMLMFHVTGTSIERWRALFEAVYSFTIIIEILGDVLLCFWPVVHRLGDMILCKTFDYLGGLMTFSIPAWLFWGCKMGMLVSQFRDTNQWCFPTAPGILCYFYEICRVFTFETHHLLVALLVYID